VEADDWEGAYEVAIGLAGVGVGQVAPEEQERFDRASGIVEGWVRGLFAVQWDDGAAVDEIWAEARRAAQRAEQGVGGPSETKPTAVDRRDLVITEPAKPVFKNSAAQPSDGASVAGRLAAALTIEPTPPSSPSTSSVEQARQVASPFSLGRNIGFQHSKSPTGIPASLHNALAAIRELGIECRHDEFHDKIIVKGHECGEDGNLDNVTLKVRQAVLERYGFDPSGQFTFDALKILCLDNVFDPVRDYLDGLRWDGEQRLDSWLIQYCGAQNTPFNRAIGRKMLIAGVRRVRSPGCKFDYMVVLEGSQGVGKSSLLKILAGEENFSDGEILGLDKREQQEGVQGVWIYEVAELEGLSRADATRVKLFISKTVDMARPAFGRARVDRPRRCIFVGTTNEEEYLRDTTGNRRYWPVKVGKIDLAGVARDRDQLWAEAAAAEATGEPLVIDEELWSDAAAEQSARVANDPWEDVLCTALARLVWRGKDIEGKFVRAADQSGEPECRVSSDHLLTDVLSLPKERQHNNHTKRLATIMRGLGWHKPDTVVRIGRGDPKRGFTKACEREEG
jgi:predicted P-loop ATPase